MKKRQSSDDLQDKRGGTYDTRDPGSPPDEQAGRAKDVDMPEGLKRPRKGPYDRDAGRAPIKPPAKE